MNGTELLKPEPEYKRLQREAEMKLKRSYRITKENNKPGMIFTDMTGVTYEVQKDGSWRKYNGSKK